jgi:hypothetical protein
MGRIESDSISRYIINTERKFEKNWKKYEESLKAFLDQKQPSEFKEWV